MPNSFRLTDCATFAGPFQSVPNWMQQLQNERARPPCGVPFAQSPQNSTVITARDQKRFGPLASLAGSDHRRAETRGENLQYHPIAQPKLNNWRLQTPPHHRGPLHGCTGVGLLILSADCRDTSGSKSLDDPREIGLAAALLHKIGIECLGTDAHGHMRASILCCP